MRRKMSKMLFSQIALSDDITKEDLVAQTRYYRKIGFWCSIAFWGPFLLMILFLAVVDAILLITMLFSGITYMRIETVYVNPIRLFVSLGILLVFATWIAVGIAPGLMLFTDCIKEWRYKRYKFTETQEKYVTLERKSQN